MKALGDAQLLGQPAVQITIVIDLRQVVNKGQFFDLLPRALSGVTQAEILGNAQDDGAEQQRTDGEVLHAFQRCRPYELQNDVAGEQDGQHRGQEEDAPEASIYGFCFFAICSIISIQLISPDPIL